MSFAALLSLYLEDLTLRRCAPSTCASALCVLPRFFDHLRRERVNDPRRVAEAHVVSFARRLAGLAPATQAHYLAVVKTFFRFLERRDVVLIDPARGLVLPRRDRLPRALSEAQARRLVNAPDRFGTKGQRDRALLELLYGTGLRMSECTRLDLPDVDLAQRIVLVRNGKGRKDRLVPLSGKAFEALDTYLREARPELMKRSAEPALFLARTGRRLSAMSLRLLVRSYGAHVKVKASCHVLRHSYATHLLQGGANVREIQRLLGHKHLTTTALYTRIDTRDLAAMIRRCHPRERTARRCISR